ncbi:MAG: alanine dehydrogenase [Flavobacteriaceae bacterium]|nr:alanine dehydrogenase [Flavobacteriaceae bacterium]
MALSKETESQETESQTLTQAVGIKKNSGSLSIGIPKEVTFQENRVPLSPFAVAYFVSNGHKIVLESNAGLQANFSDMQYSEAGAHIVSNNKEVYACDTILKIDPPTLTEVELMKPGQLLISALQINQLDSVLLRKLMDKKINAIAYEFLEDDAGTRPIIRAMSEIAGTASVLIASEYLNNNHSGKGELLGGFAGVPPTQLVIIGAGAVAEFAAKAALGLGANVKIFDNNMYRLRRIQKSFGFHLYTSTIQPLVLKKAIASADVVIGALSGKTARSPIVVSEDMVMAMRANSVLIDIAIDGGGNFETSELTNHEKPVFKKHGVFHYCVPNIASRVSRTASYALSNVFTPILTEMGEINGFGEFLRLKSGIRKGTYLYRGNLCNKNLAEKFGIKFHDIDLLVGLFM